MTDKEIKKTFLIRYFTKYYIFGYCCFFGFIPQAFFYFLSSLIPKPYCYIPYFFLTIGSILLFGKWLRITTLSKRKFRFYRLAIKKLEAGDFDKNYFLNGMYDPCFKVIVKDLLYRYGMKEYYQSLKNLKKIIKHPFIREDDLIFN